MDIHKRVKKLVVEKTGDSWTVQVDKKTYECTGVSIDVHDIVGDVSLFGIDNPNTYETYEEVRKVELEREPDDSIYIIVYVLGF